MGKGGGGVREEVGEKGTGRGRRWRWRMEEEERGLGRRRARLVGVETEKGRLEPSPAGLEGGRGRSAGAVLRRALWSKSSRGSGQRRGPERGLP